MKKLFLLLAASAMVFASCSKDDNRAETPAGDDMYVSFHVKAPASGVVTYATVPDAVPEESKVNVLYVYVFGPNGGTNGNTDDYTLEGFYTYKNPSANATDYLIDNVKVSGRNLKHIYFVANRLNSMVVGTTLETSMVNAGCGTVSTTGSQPFISLTGHEDYVSKGLPMSAYTEVDFTTGTADPATHPGVALLRGVARFDLQNATENYTIESIVVRSRDNGYMFPSEFNVDGTYKGLLYTGMDAFTVANTSREDNFGYAGNKNNYGEIDLLATRGSYLAPGGDADPVANPSEMFGAGYLYEASATDGASLVIKCRNNVTNELRALEIPFEQSNAAIAVERNYVYTFKIHETVYQGLEASFIVAEWEDSPAVLEIEVPMVVAFNLVSNNVLADGETLTSSATSWTLGNVPLAGGSYSINVDAQGVAVSLLDADQLTDYPWIKNFAIALNADGKTYDVTFEVDTRAAGKTYNRTASLILKADLPTSPAMTFVVSQKYN